MYYLLVLYTQTRQSARSKAITLTPPDAADDCSTAAADAQVNSLTASPQRSGVKTNVFQWIILCVLQTQTEPGETATSVAAALPPPDAAEDKSTAASGNASNLLNVSSN